MGKAREPTKRNRNSENLQKGTKKHDKKMEKE